nr:MAG TPA: hypothetical protein [Caudoviricetes sp.]
MFLVNLGIFLNTKHYNDIFCLNQYDIHWLIRFYVYIRRN